MKILSRIINKYKFTRQLNYKPVRKFIKIYSRIIITTLFSFLKTIHLADGKFPENMISVFSFSENTSRNDIHSLFSFDKFIINNIFKKLK